MFVGIAQKNSQWHIMIRKDFHLVAGVFAGEEVSHGFFSRHGGVSAGDFASLNIGLQVGDNPEQVQENRQRIQAYLGLECLVAARQVHGDRVQVVTADGVSNTGEIDGCDALITDIPGVGLMIQQADCQAVMLHDPVKKAIANIHAGWRGSVVNIIGKAVARMTEYFGTDPADLRSAISPSLGPCCAEFIHYRQELPCGLHKYQVRENHFDFWAISGDQLLAAGLQKENISIARVCTRCNEDFFSFRRAKRTGRCASVIGLR